MYSKKVSCEQQPVADKADKCASRAPRRTRMGLVERPPPLGSRTNDEEHQGVHEDEQVAKQETADRSETTTDENVAKMPNKKCRPHEITVTKARSDEQT